MKSKKHNKSKSSRRPKRRSDGGLLDLFSSPEEKAVNVAQQKVDDCEKIFPAKISQINKRLGELEEAIPKLGAKLTTDKTVLDKKFESDEKILKDEQTKLNADKKELEKKIEYCDKNLPTFKNDVLKAKDVLNIKIASDKAASAKATKERNEKIKAGFSSFTSGVSSLGSKMASLGSKKSDAPQAQVDGRRRRKRRSGSLKKKSKISYGRRRRKSPSKKRSTKRRPRRSIRKSLY